MSPTTSTTAVAVRAAELLALHGWGQDAIRSCNFEMYSKTSGRHCIGRAVNIAADQLNLPFEPIHEELAAIIRDRQPAFALLQDPVDVIAEWNNHPSVTLQDVLDVLAAL